MNEKLKQLEDRLRKLGLLVSQSIVQKHGGRIEVVSEIGKGSTFTLVGPCS